MSIFDRITARIDSLSNWSVRLVKWLLVVLILNITYDVTMRYLFSAPTKWSYDISYMLGGTVYVMGLAYVLLHKENVRVDVFHRRFGPRTRLLVDLVFSLVFFFPLTIVLLKESIDQAWLSWVLRETSKVGWWMPPLYPFRTVVPVGLSLLLLQGIATFGRDLRELLSTQHHD
jgi:TRAP-type mannitol/chloroaromatic compound transport system permease small subunit